MKVKAKKVLDIELNDKDKTILGNAYDLAWLIQHRLLNQLEAEWLVDDRESLINDCEEVLKAVSNLAHHFDSDDEFSEWGDGLPALEEV